MTKLTLFLVSICLIAVVECTGFNYYWPYQGSQDIVAIPQIPQYVPIQSLWPPIENCDKKEDMEEGSNESSSSESSSSESSSSESSSSESEEGKESGEEKEGEGEGEGSKEESKSSSEEEEGSSSSEEGEKKEGSGEEEGKEEPKKKKKKEEKESKPYFPSYIFPPRPAAMYAPSSSYSLLPFRGSYVLQQRPVTTYPVKSSYQYVMPASSAILGGYNSPITYSRVINPVPRLSYSAPTMGYPTITKTYVQAAPSASVYSVPAASVAYIKK